LFFNFKGLYLEAIKYVPDKFNEIIGLLSSKEIRVRLPIEELDMLLEPIKSKNQIDEDERDEEMAQENDSEKESSSSNDQDDDNDAQLI
jgi:hypothetical protein